MVNNIQNAENRPQTITSGKDVTQSTTTRQVENEKDEGNQFMGRFLRTRRHRPLSTENTTNHNQLNSFVLQCKLPLDRIEDILSKIKKTELSNVDKSDNVRSDLSVQTDVNPITNNSDLINSDLLTNHGENANDSVEISKNNTVNTPPRIMCLFCDRTFVSNMLLQKHTERCHHISPNRRFSSRNIDQTPSANFHPGCNFCSKNSTIQTATNLSVLFDHLVNEHAVKYFACKKCKIRFSTKDILINHNRDEHGIDVNDVDVSVSEDCLTDTKDKDTVSGKCTRSSNYSIADKSPLNTSITQISSSNHSDIKNKLNDIDCNPQNLTENVASSTERLDDIKTDRKIRITNRKLKNMDEDQFTSDQKDFHGEKSVKQNKEHKHTPEKVKSTHLDYADFDENASTNFCLPQKKHDSSNFNKKNNIDQNAVIILDDINYDNKLFKNKQNVVSIQNSIKPDEKDNQMLSRLGVAQNRSLRARSLRGSRKTPLTENRACSETPRKDKAKVKTDNNDYFVINKNKNDPNSKFDPDFYSNISQNVRENLMKYLDGKLGSQNESSVIHDIVDPKIKSTHAIIQSISAQPAEIHGSDVNLNAITVFPTLLTSDQYGSDKVPHYSYGANAQTFKKIITKNSWKWKWDPVKKYKYCNEDGKIVRKIRPLQHVSPRDLSKLDIWTQLTMREKFEQSNPQSFTISDEKANDRSERQKQINELNMILDKRTFPNIDNENKRYNSLSNENKDSANSSQNGSPKKVPLINQDEAVPGCSKEDTDKHEVKNCSFLNQLGLIKVNPPEPTPSTSVLSGEWARPRCYICCVCGRRADCLRLLDAHQASHHPHANSTYYEIVGQDMLDIEVYKYMYLPETKLNHDKNSKQDSNVKNVKKMSQSALHSHKSSRILRTTTRSIKSLEKKCTKCKKMLAPHEFYKHILECAGDYGWIMLKKKCKYKPFGARRRRLKGLYKREVPQEEERVENKDNTVRPKLPPRPRTKPSDAETIQRMLANLPPKRTSRQIHDLSPSKSKIAPSSGKKSPATRTTTPDTKTNMKRNKIVTAVKSGLRKKIRRLTRSVSNKIQGKNMENEKCTEIDLNTKTKENVNSNVTKQKKSDIREKNNSHFEDVESNTNDEEKNEITQYPTNVPSTKSSEISAESQSNIKTNEKPQRIRGNNSKNDVFSVAANNEKLEEDINISQKTLRRKTIVSSKIINLPLRKARNNKILKDKEENPKSPSTPNVKSPDSTSVESKENATRKNKKNKRRLMGFPLKWIGNKKVHFTKSKRTAKRKKEIEETVVMDNQINDKDIIQDGTMESSLQDETASSSTDNINTEEKTLSTDILNKSIPPEKPECSSDTVKKVDISNEEINSPEPEKNVINENSKTTTTISPNIPIISCSSNFNYNNNNFSNSNNNCNNNNNPVKNNDSYKHGAEHDNRSSKVVDSNTKIYNKSNSFAVINFAEYERTEKKSEENIIEPIRRPDNAYFVSNANIDKPPLYRSPPRAHSNVSESHVRVYSAVSKIPNIETPNMSSQIKPLNFDNNGTLCKTSKIKPSKNKRGLNDCIAMLKGKLIEKTSTFPSTPLPINERIHCVENEEMQQPLDLSGRIPQPEDLSMKSCVSTNQPTKPTSSIISDIRTKSVVSTNKEVVVKPSAVINNDFMAKSLIPVSNEPLVKPSSSLNNEVSIKPFNSVSNETLIKSSTPVHNTSTPSTSKFTSPPKPPTKPIYDAILKIPQFSVSSVNSSNIRPTSNIITSGIPHVETPKKSRSDFSIPSLLSPDKKVSRNIESFQHSQSVLEVPQIRPMIIGPKAPTDGIEKLTLTQREELMNALPKALAQIVEIHLLKNNNVTTSTKPIPKESDHKQVKQHFIEDILAPKPEIPRENTFSIAQIVDNNIRDVSVHNKKTKQIVKMNLNQEKLEPTKKNSDFQNVNTDMFLIDPVTGIIAERSTGTIDKIETIPPSFQKPVIRKVSDIIDLTKNSEDNVKITTKTSATSTVLPDRSLSLEQKDVAKELPKYSDDKGSISLRAVRIKSVAEKYNQKHVEQEIIRDETHYFKSDINTLPTNFMNDNQIQQEVRVDSSIPRLVENDSKSKTNKKEITNTFKNIVSEPIIQQDEVSSTQNSNLEDNLTFSTFKNFLNKKDEIITEFTTPKPDATRKSFEVPTEPQKTEIQPIETDVTKLEKNDAKNEVIVEKKVGRKKTSYNLKKQIASDEYASIAEDEILSINKSKPKQKVAVIKSQTKTKPAEVLEVTNIDSLNKYKTQCVLGNTLKDFNDKTPSNEADNIQLSLQLIDQNIISESALTPTHITELKTSNREEKVEDNNALVSPDSKERDTITSDTKKNKYRTKTKTVKKLSRKSLPEPYSNNNLIESDIITPEIGRTTQSEYPVSRSETAQDDKYPKTLSTLTESTILSGNEESDDDICLAAMAKKRIEPSVHTEQIFTKNTIQQENEKNLNIKNVSEDNVVLQDILNPFDAIQKCSINDTEKLKTKHKKKSKSLKIIDLNDKTLAEDNSKTTRWKTRSLTKTESVKTNDLDVSEDKSDSNIKEDVINESDTVCKRGKRKVKTKHEVESITSKPNIRKSDRLSHSRSKEEELPAKITTINSVKLSENGHLIFKMQKDNTANRVSENNVESNKLVKIDVVASSTTANDNSIRISTENESTIEKDSKNKDIVNREEAPKNITENYQLKGVKSPLDESKNISDFSKPKLRRTRQRHTESNVNLQSDEIIPAYVTQEAQKIEKVVNSLSIDLQNNRGVCDSPNFDSQKEDYESNINAYDDSTNDSNSFSNEKFLEEVDKMTQMISMNIETSIPKKSRATKEKNKQSIAADNSIVSTSTSNLDTSSTIDDMKNSNAPQINPPYSINENNLYKLSKQDKNDLNLQLKISPKDTVTSDESPNSFESKKSNKSKKTRKNKNIDADSLLDNVIQTVSESSKGNLSLRFIKQNKNNKDASVSESDNSIVDSVFTVVSHENILQKNNTALMIDNQQSAENSNTFDTIKETKLRKKRSNKYSVTADICNKTELENTVVENIANNALISDSPKVTVSDTKNIAQESFDENTEFEKQSEIEALSKIAKNKKTRNRRIAKSFDSTQNEILITNKDKSMDTSQATNDIFKECEIIDNSLKRNKNSNDIKTNSVACSNIENMTKTAVSESIVGIKQRSNKDDNSVIVKDDPKIHLTISMVKDSASVNKYDIRTSDIDKNETESSIKTFDTIESNNVNTSKELKLSLKVHSKKKKGSKRNIDNDKETSEVDYDDELKLKMNRIDKNQDKKKYVIVDQTNVYNVSSIPIPISENKAKDLQNDLSVFDFNEVIEDKKKTKNKKHHSMEKIKLTHVTQETNENEDSIQPLSKIQLKSNEFKAKSLESSKKKKNKKNDHAFSSNEIENFANLSTIDPNHDPYNFVADQLKPENSTKDPYIPEFNKFESRRKKTNRHDHLSNDEDQYSTKFYAETKIKSEKHATKKLDEIINDKPTEIEEGDLNDYEKQDAAQFQTSQLDKNSINDFEETFNIRKRRKNRNSKANRENIDEMFDKQNLNTSEDINLNNTVECDVKRNVKEMKNKNKHQIENDESCGNVDINDSFIKVSKKSKKKHHSNRHDINTFGNIIDTKTSEENVLDPCVISKDNEELRKSSKNCFEIIDSTLTSLKENKDDNIFETIPTKTVITTDDFNQTFSNANLAERKSIDENSEDLDDINNYECEITPLDDHDEKSDTDLDLTEKTSRLKNKDIIGFKIKNKSKKVRNNSPFYVSKGKKMKKGQLSITMDNPGKSNTSPSRNITMFENDSHKEMTTNINMDINSKTVDTSIVNAHNDNNKKEIKNTVVVPLNDDLHTQTELNSNKSRNIVDNRKNKQDNTITSKSKETDNFYSNTDSFEKNDQFTEQKRSSLSEASTDMSADLSENDKESLIQDKYLANFGMYTEKRPRKSTILAIKKISQTFKPDSSDTDETESEGGSTPSLSETMRLQKKRSKKSQSEIKSQAENISRIEDDSMTTEMNSDEVTVMEEKQELTDLSKENISKSPTPERKSYENKPDTYCAICKRKFRRPENLLKHKTTLMHISKLSEIEAEEMKNKPDVELKSSIEIHIDTSCVSEDSNIAISEEKKEINDIGFSKHLVVDNQSTRPHKNLAERKSFENETTQNLSVPVEPVNNFSHEIYKSDSDVEKIDTTVSIPQEVGIKITRKKLSRDEALFFECCSLLKESDSGRKQVRESDLYKQTKIDKPDKISSKDKDSPVVTYNVHSSTVVSEPLPAVDHQNEFEEQGENLPSNSSNLEMNNDKYIGKNQTLKPINSVYDFEIENTLSCIPDVKINKVKDNRKQFSDGKSHLLENFNEDSSPTSNIIKENDLDSISSTKDYIDDTNEPSPYHVESLIVRTNSNDFSDNGDSIISGKETNIGSNRLFKAKNRNIDLQSKKLTESNLDATDKNVDNKTVFKKIAYSEDLESHENRDNSNLETKSIESGHNLIDTEGSENKNSDHHKKNNLLNTTIDDFSQYVFEDKFDKIKRKAREKAQAAQEALAATLSPNIYPRSRKKTHSKSRKSSKQSGDLSTKSLKISKSRRSSKKKSHNKDYQKLTSKKILTKGALKGFDSVKVSIPTEGMNILENSKSNLQELVEYALQDGIGETLNKSDGTKLKARKDTYPKKINNDKDTSSSFEYRNTPNMSSARDSYDHHTDIYEFFDDDNDDNNMKFNLTSDKHSSTSKKLSDNHFNTNNDKIFPEVHNDDSQISSLSFSDRDDFVYMSDDYHGNQSEEDSSSNSNDPTSHSSKMFKRMKSKSNKKITKKSAIMGRIFKNNAIRNEQKLVNEDFVETHSKKSPICTRTNMDQLFDSLLEKNVSSTRNTKSNDKLSSAELSDGAEYENQDDENSNKPSVVENSLTGANDLSDFDDSESEEEKSQSPIRVNSRKIVPRLKARSSDDEMSTNMKNNKILDNYGDKMLLNSYQDNIGVASRKSQRKCTTGKQNILVESWSSESDFEDFRQFEEYSSVPRSQKHHRKPRRSRRHRFPNEQRLLDNQRMEMSVPSIPPSFVKKSFNSPPEVAEKSFIKHNIESDKHQTNKTYKLPEDNYFRKDSDAELDINFSDRFLKMKNQNRPRTKPPTFNKRKVSFNNAASSSVKGSSSRKRRKQSQRPFDYDDEFKPTRIAGPLVTPKRNKRTASDQLYYWSSSSDEELPNATIDSSSREPEPIEQHGWIVGDSHKKLVTMLAHAKGRKLDDNATVKEKKTKMQN